MLKAITQAELYKIFSGLIKSKDPDTHKALTDLLYDLSPVTVQVFIHTSPEPTKIAG